MSRGRKVRCAGYALLMMGAAQAAPAEDLYRNSNWAAISADRRASNIGDALTVVVYQAAEASTLAQTKSRRSTDLGGKIGAGSFDESASLQFGGGYTGGGEVRRSERLVAEITVIIRDVLPNGDLVVVGEQSLNVNGERTRIGVRGRVRPADISRDNKLLSSRIADAQIDYNGRGFVSKSARPGLVNRLFRFLGLG